MTARRDAALIAALERSRIHPLWDRYKRITPVAPKAKDAPMHWRWREIELKAADFQSVRGAFKFGRNQFPVQNYYLQLVGKGADGRLVHKTIGTVLTNRADAYGQDCKMK